MLFIEKNIAINNNEYKNIIISKATKYIPIKSECILLLYRGLVNNIGDAAIQLGQHILIEKLKLKIKYCARSSEYSSDIANKVINKNTIILISGGGSMGDFHVKAQLFKEEIVAQFPNNRIVILPQSIIFENKKQLIRARNTMIKHKKLVVFARDNDSYWTSKNELGLKTELVPDMAYMIEKKSIVHKFNNSNNAILLLLRKDSEKKINTTDLEYRNKYIIKDWPIIGETIVNKIYWKVLKILHLISVSLTKVNPIFINIEWSIKKYTTYVRVYDGIEFINKYKIIVTDRLHGVLIGRHLDKSVILIDNKTSKVKKFYKSYYINDNKVNFISNINELEDVIQKIKEKNNNN